MDPQTFDQLARLAAATRTRRGVLKTLIGGAAGLLAMSGGRVEAKRLTQCASEQRSCADHPCCEGLYCEADGRCHPADCNVPCPEGSMCFVTRSAFGACCPTDRVCPVDRAKLGLFADCCDAGAACVSGEGCCQPGGNQPLGAPCAADAECCSGSCATGTCCLANGSYTHDAVDCCSGFAPGSHCVPCLSGSNDCRADADCCTGSCAAGRCVGCVAPGGHCSSGSADCCHGDCGDGICPTPCQPAGTRCRHDVPCCGGGSCVKGTCRVPVTDVPVPAAAR